MDDFLFTSRKGFCEHFATGFGVLMRAAGVPTRLVGGYQWGRWNDLGDFLTVRHSDAHVWCEVWLAGRGWVRVDPTFVVAPERIDVGIEGAFAGEGLLAFLGSDQANVLVRWTGTLRQAWEAANTRWNMWFMGFSAEDQLSLLKQLGLSAGRRGGWLLFMVLPSLFIVAVALLGRMRNRTRRRLTDDRVLKIYGRFLDKMERIGMPKAPHQGPLDYARSVALRHPVLKPEVAGIVEEYIGLRYGPQRRSGCTQGFPHAGASVQPAAGAVCRREKDRGRTSEAGSRGPAALNPNSQFSVRAMSLGGCQRAPVNGDRPKRSAIRSTARSTFSHPLSRKSTSENRPACCGVVSAINADAPTPISRTGLSRD